MITITQIGAAVAFLVALISGIGFLMNRTKAWVFSAVKDEFGRLDGKIDKITEKQDSLEVKMERSRADDARRMILNYNDELLRHIEHSKESFDQILRDVDEYERYSKHHPDYPNNQAVAAISHIKQCYKRCLDESLFLQ